MAAYSELSPSSSSRWIACPGSIQKTRDLPARAGNDAALRGTRIHYLAEKISNGETFEVGTKIKGDASCKGEFLIEKDMMKEAVGYVDFISNLHLYGELILKISEMKIDLTSKDQKYVALSRAKNSIKIIKE